MPALFFVASGVFGVELESALDGVPGIPARPCPDLHSHSHSPQAKVLTLSAANVVVGWPCTMQLIGVVVSVPCNARDVSYAINTYPRIGRVAVMDARPKIGPRNWRAQAASDFLRPASSYAIHRTA